MSITAANILTRVNQILHRAETDIDNILLEGLKELSLRSGELKGSASGSVSTVDDSIDKPSDFISADEITIDTVPLTRQLTFQEYLEDNLEGHAERGSKLYIAPSSTSARSYVLYYTKYHADSVATIEFADKWQKALIYWCCAGVSEHYKIQEDVEYYRGKFEAELLLKGADDEMAVTKGVQK